MKSVLLGIFAHPDDEANGPSGTLLKLATEGVDIHLLVLTNGEAGSNELAVPDLGVTRLREWQAAGTVIGIKSSHAAGLPDGQLETIPAETIDETVQGYFQSVKDQYNEQIKTSIMCFEPTGLTGHRDHIAATEAAVRLFKRLKSEGSAGKLWQYCLSKEQAPLEQTPYYHPQARDDSFITDRVDTLPFLSQKYAVIDCHQSQVQDRANIKALGDTLLSTECFNISS